MTEVSELRRNPLTDRWVIIATNRSKRPDDYSDVERNPEICPFCEGNEHMTPKEVLAYRNNGSQPDTPGWWIRTTPNKYPALQIEGSLDSRVKNGFEESMESVGASDVIIETPKHEDPLENRDLYMVQELLRMYRDNINRLESDPRFKYILIFQNHGKVAGASLEHPHSQILATPEVSTDIMGEIIHSRAYYEDKGKCFYCEWIGEELRKRKRIITENSDFVAISPFFSRFPYEMWIFSRNHESDYGGITSDGEISSLAEILQGSIRALHNVFPKQPEPPYNMYLHTAPTTNNYDEFFHWHFVIIPRMTTPAGAEFGVGYYINPTPPEQAAEDLRAALSQ